MNQTTEQNIIIQHLPNIFDLINRMAIVKIISPIGSNTSTILASGLSVTLPAGTIINIVVPTGFGAKMCENNFRNIAGTGSIRSGYKTINDINVNDNDGVRYISRDYLIQSLLEYNGSLDRSNTNENYQRYPWEGPIYIIDNTELSNIELDIIFGMYINQVNNNQGDNIIPRLIMIGSDDKSFDFPILEPIYNQSQPHRIEFQNIGRQINFTNYSYRLNDDRLYQEIAQTILRYHNSKTRGDYIVYLPTISEIKLVENFIKNYDRQKVLNRNVIIISVHDNSSIETISRLLKIEQKRKIILVSNNVSSQLNIPNIGLVIDSLRIQIKQRSNNDNIEKVIEYITKRESENHLSQISKSFQGIYHPMTKQEDYNKLKDTRLREIYRLPLYHYALKLLDYNVDPHKILIDGFSELGINMIYSQNLGFVDNNNRLTPYGKLAKQLPLSLENSATLIRWFNTRLTNSEQYLPLFPAILAVSIIETANIGYFRLPRKIKNQSNSEYKSSLSTYKRTNYTKYKGDNDLETSMNIVMDLFNTTKCLSGGPEAITQWVNSNKIYQPLINKTLDMINILISIVKSWGREVQISPFNIKSAINHLRGIIQNTYNRRLMVLERSLYKELSTGKMYNLNLRSTYSNLITNKPCQIIGLVTNSYNIANGSERNSILLALDVASTPKESPNINTLIGSSGSQISGRFRPQNTDLPPPLVSQNPEGSIPKSVSTRQELIQWITSYNVAELNLNPEELEIWNKNLHIRRVFYNRKLYPQFWNFVKAGRQLSELDRYIRLPDDPNPTPTMEYQTRRPGEVRTVEYWGQRKLFMVVMEFLLYYGNKSKTVVYAGAAPGVYFNYLSELFPEHTFHLYDPRHIQAEGPRIKKYQQLFTNDTALEWLDKNVIFLSDIRRDIQVRQVGQYELDEDTSEETEQTVKEDMEMQKEWVTIMKPLVSSLKFRLPYSQGKTKYFKGVLMIQPWAPKASTENRLIVEDPSENNMIEYDNLWHSNVMYWHNNFQRTVYYEHSVEGGEGLDHCYDCATEIMILSIYLFRDGITDTNKLIEEIKNMSKTISRVISNNRTLKYPEGPRGS